MKAVVLTAGEGRRLRPLTKRRPKPMLPVGNKPVLEHVVEAVSEAGIEELVFVVGYRRDRIQTYFGDGDDWGVNIEYVVQEKRLGTGHALLQAEDVVNEEFIVLNGDSVIGSGVVKEMSERDEETVVGITHSDEPSDYGVVDIKNGRVTRIVEKPKYGAERDTVNAGVYRLKKNVFDEIREDSGGGEMSLVSILTKRAGEKEVFAVHTEGWADISHLWDLVSLNASTVGGDREGSSIHPTAYVADNASLGEDARVGPNATVLPGTAVGSNTVIDSGAVVGNSVLFADSRVGEGAVLRDAVVAEDVRVGSNVTVEGGSADVVVDGKVHQDVRLGGVIGDGSCLRGGSCLRPGTVLGNDVEVGTGAKVGGRVHSGTEVQ